MNPHSRHIGSSNNSATNGTHLPAVSRMRSRVIDRRRIVMLAAAALLPAAESLAQSPRWTAISSPIRPSSRWQQAMSFDSLRGTVVLFGGRTGSTTYVNDTWEFDGEVWRLIPTTNPPVARNLADMVFDRARGESVMFGGSVVGFPTANETWTWNGGSWTLKSPAASPPRRWLPALAYDSNRNVVVLFGGMVSGATEGNDTWEWDGTSWAQVFTANAPSPRMTRLAYDSARGRLVMFGGNRSGGPAFDDTWEYDGVTWVQVPTPVAPLARSAHVLEFDVSSQRVVLFGGYSYVTNQNFGDTWEFDGTTWTQVFPPSSPLPRRGSDQSAYDSTTGRVVVFGGLADPGTLTDETWVYRSATTGLFSVLGAPCGASSVSLSATTPTIGQTFQLTVGNLGAAPFALVVHGLSTTLWNGVPLPVDLGLLGLPGCTLRTSVDLLQVAGATAGSAAVSLAIPLQPNLLDFRLHCQAVAVDLSLPQFALAMSPLGRMVIGN